MRRLHFVDWAFAGRPAFDAAVSRALLELVATGAAPETFRLYRPDDVLAFSGLDAASAGFAAAVGAARAAGFAPTLRLAGGRAAVFHRATLAFAWTVPAPDPRDGIAARFEALADLVAAALRRLGVDARVGAVRGEYCPGDHSVNARGARKLMGVGQRVIRGAAHVGGVIVVDDAARVREVLEPVYAAMRFTWNPATTGSIADEIGTVSLEAVASALRAELGTRHDVAPGDPLAPAAVLRRAAELEDRFRLAADGAPRRDPQRLAGKTAREIS